MRPPRTDAERRALHNELPNPTLFDGSPSAQGHFGSSKQASTWLEGPSPGNLSVQILDLENQLGKYVGTSPWHVVSTRRYLERKAVTIWGATLTDAYRIIVDGERFEATDRFAINRFPISLPWNLFAADDGRVFVPDPAGRRLRPGRTSGPTLLVLSDDPNGSGRLDQGINLLQAVELDEDALRAACRPPRSATLVKGETGSNFRPGFNGEIITKVVYKLDDGEIRSYLVALDTQFEIIAGGEIGPTAPSNDIPAEPDGPGRTAFYVATDVAIVKMVFDSSRRTMERRWTVQLPIRGRFGTTPTLMNTPDGERFVIAVDAKAAVVSGFNGLIAYSPDTRPNALIAVRRDDQIGGKPRVITFELPEWLGAIENSPAVRGGVAVITNYTGYLPNGLAIPPGGQAPPAKAASWGQSPDARPEFATGVLAVAYAPALDSFEILWQRPDIQYSGIATISESSNIVYGAGAEWESGMTYFYGLRLLDDANGRGGELIIREELGVAPFREPRRDRRGNFGFERSDYRFAEGEFFDAGNSLIILEDGSAIVNGGRALARIRAR
ncbi:MAG: hypothetical protein EA376_11875 [Phycisphaeraceae bacterium]|nr:MAG: hypothetical protein EA376_11875 [Phycisphaeraceae bacterium]